MKDLSQYTKTVFWQSNFLLLYPTVRFISLTVYRPSFLFNDELNTFTERILSNTATKPHSLTDSLRYDCLGTSQSRPSPLLINHTLQIKLDLNLSEEKSKKF